MPYYNGHPEIEPVINLKGPYEKIKTISSIYPYNSLLLPIVSGNLHNGKKKDFNIKGYIPIKKTTQGPLRTIDYTRKHVLDPKKINIYRAFINECISANIELYIVCPPYLVNAVGNDLSTETAKKIANEYHVNFIDYSRDSFYIQQPQLFADFRHLNGKGADIFTEQVAAVIDNN